jgi:hypothetical protein
VVHKFQIIAGAAVLFLRYLAEQVKRPFRYGILNSGFIEYRRESVAPAGLNVYVNLCVCKLRHYALH